MSQARVMYFENKVIERLDGLLSQFPITTNGYVQVVFHKDDVTTHTYLIPYKHLPPDGLWLLGVLDHGDLRYCTTIHNRLITWLTRAFSKYTLDEMEAKFAIMPKPEMCFTVGFCNGKLPSLEKSEGQ